MNEDKQNGKQTSRNDKRIPEKPSNMGSILIE